MPSDETYLELTTRQWRGALPDEREQALFEHIADLELARQLRLLRVMLPSVLEQLPQDEQRDFMRSLGSGR